MPPICSMSKQNKKSRKNVLVIADNWIQKIKNKDKEKCNCCGHYFRVKTKEEKSEFETHKYYCEGRGGWGYK